MRLADRRSRGGALDAVEGGEHRLPRWTDSMSVGEGGENVPGGFTPTTILPPAPHAAFTRAKTPVPESRAFFTLVRIFVWFLAAPSASLSCAALAFEPGRFAGARPALLPLCVDLVFHVPWLTLLSIPSLNFSAIVPMLLLSVLAL